MNTKKHLTFAGRFVRFVLVVAGIGLAALSALTVMTVLEIPWQNWIASRAQGVMAYIELEEQTLPGSVEVSGTEVRTVEWSGVQSAAVSGSDVSLMSEPDGASDILCKMESGRSVTIVEQHGNWYRLRYCARVGWVPLSYVRTTGEKNEYPEDMLDTLHADTDAASAEFGRLASDSDAVTNLDYLSRYYGAVGAQVAVIKGGKVVYSYNYGYQNRKEQVPVTTDTKIRIASISKVGVAMAAAAMAEQGIVDLDADISDYLGFTVRNPQYAGTPITLRMLLTHTSSMLDEISEYETYKSFVQKLGEKSFYHTGWRPGGDGIWSYSNSGICTAGMTLEAAAGVPLVDYIDTYFFEPMGVDASYHASHIKDSSLIADLYYSNGNRAFSVKNQLERPYTEKAGENFRLYAGDLTISAVDLAKLFCILINDGTYDGMYYLSPETVEMMETAQIDLDNFAQCFTLRVKENFCDGRRLYYHTGSAYGTLSFASYDPETGDGVVIVTTGASGDKIKGVFACGYKMANYIYSDLLH